MEVHVVVARGQTGVGGCIGSLRSPAVACHFRILAVAVGLHIVVVLESLTAEVAASCHVEGESLVGEGDVGTHGPWRTPVAENHRVFAVDDAVIVHVLILEVARLGVCAVNACRGGNFLFRLEETETLVAAERAARLTF